ncbi:hypothetical protein [Methanosarcina sp.]|uniref:hypothetical protein n=1 Tax=Methanosarcina sp. TaxID=2213 RepID=UPI0029889D65|nr:hypothetical protein [Methanosarcina sp.]MDW5549609.1 hypothetical protein [Methanosarcina sp.]MDW5553641.1 hypothetical protein [Methanosarcina sp.]MDW5558553.1 hypothetical protein [Methanosarcina sp.]
MKTTINVAFTDKSTGTQLHGNVNFGDDETNSTVQIRQVSIQRYELYGDITVSNAAIIPQQKQIT